MAVCLDNLGNYRSLYLYYAKEWVRSAARHGILPVPVPAVTHIVQQWSESADHSGTGLVTPTGAAIVAAVRTSCKLPETFAIEKNRYRSRQEDV